MRPTQNGFHLPARTVTFKFQDRSVGISGSECRIFQTRPSEIAVSEKRIPVPLSLTYSSDLFPPDLFSLRSGATFRITLRDFFSFSSVPFYFRKFFPALYKSTFRTEIEVWTSESRIARASVKLFLRDCNRNGNRSIERKERTRKFAERSRRYRRNGIRYNGAIS